MKKKITINKDDLEALLILAKRGMFTEQEVSSQAHASYEMLIHEMEKKVKA